MQTAIRDQIGTGNTHLIWTQNFGAICEVQNRAYIERKLKREQCTKNKINSDAQKWQIGLNAVCDDSDKLDFNESKIKLYRVKGKMDKL